jgi:hypothetical protein
MAPGPTDPPAPFAPPAPPPRRRSAGRWILLIIVWIVGLAIWAVYIAVLVMVFFRFFT